jgi:hypothetical protein
MNRMRKTLVSRRSFIAGGGVLAVFLVSPRFWKAMTSRSGTYSDTYSSTY